MSKIMHGYYLRPGLPWKKLIKWKKGEAYRKSIDMNLEKNIA